MSNFSENLATIVKNIGCDYEKIPEFVKLKSSISSNV